VLTIRKAVLKDLPAITDIYNDAILKTTATFDNNIKTLEEQKAWFEKHGDKYPVLVAQQDNLIVGWVSLSAWSDRCAYADTAEISLYVKDGYRGKGVGRKLSDAVLTAGRKAGLHTVISRIVEGNDASIHRGVSLGFKHIGVMKEVGRKYGKLLDVYLMQLIFD
jgi:phosphinothricin acetyltransferase